METGSIPVGELSGGFDLQSTLESGQSFLWQREDGNTYERSGAYGGSDWYATVHDGEVIRVRQRDGLLEWEATTDAEPVLFELLRLDDDIETILAAAPRDSLLDNAREAYQGLHIVDDPFFPCLVSFICSAQMRVQRIHRMQSGIARTFGEPIHFDGETYYGYPTPEKLAVATESQLRDLGLGYRAPYVRDSASLYADGAVGPTDLRDVEYEEARDALQTYVGVGEKVADCVLLFSLGYLDAVPLDTWIRRAIREHYPHCDHDSYAETSRAIREQFGPYPGYVQTYVFHYLRK